MKARNIVFLLILLIIAIVVINIILFNYWNKNKPSDKQEIYNPIINPSDFSHIINNRYLTFTPKTKYVYEGEVEEGIERTEVYVTEEEKEVMGVKTTVVWDRVWLNGSLIEDTKDWYAQDKDGNVWYFGEESKEIVLGEVVSTEGSWETGVDGAKPGIVMKANPKIGEVYYQEYYKGFAEDKAEIISLNEKITTPIGTFDNCLQTKDWNPLEPGGDEEYKYYCPKIAGVASEVGIESGEQVKLIELRKNTFPSPVDDIKESDSNEAATITEEDAKRIALERVPGEVTDVAIEAKFGKKTYVVEIVADNGPETDVIIDFATGEILGVES